jgi:small-conductance mechanosensitive channel
VTPSGFLELLRPLWADLHDVRVLWQIALLAFALAAAWWANRLIRPQFAGLDEKSHFAAGGLQRLQFPLTALVIVLVGRAVLKHWHAVSLLNVAVPLLTALAIARITVYALRRVFAPSGRLITSERFVVGVVWLSFAAYITGLAPDILDFLDDVGFMAGKQRISLLLVLQAALSVSITLLMAMWLGRVIESRLMNALTLDINLRVMFSKLAQALLVLAAILIALPAVGIDLTMFSIFGGAVGVGLGFGLQKIASNYVSGFIILMDRSVSIGDVVTVDKYSGELTKMTARYVVVRGLDGTETLIPNETLVTSPVVNVSYSDRRLRVAVPLQVGYRSDLKLAIKIMKDAADAHPRVLRAPAPDAVIKQFAGSGIDLELGAWIEDPQMGQAGLRSDLYAAIWDAFQANGIEIPYPQREVRIVSETPSQTGLNHPLSGQS